MKDNAGFSLVEMIVVVLIMGIITVSLAPQVMKWVGTAKQNADFQAQDDIRAMVQVAVAEYESLVTTTSIHDENYDVVSTGLRVVDGADSNLGLVSIMKFYMSETYPKVQDSRGKIFQIQLMESGQKIDVKIVSGVY